MNKKKRGNFLNWIAPARAKEEADRIEQLQEERRATRRLAHEMFLISVNASQAKEKGQKEQNLLLEERRAWDETMMHIQMTYQTNE